MTPSSNLAIVGYGKMGRLIDQLASEYGFSVTARLDVNRDEPLDNIDVAIEFSIPEAVVANVTRLAERGIPASGIEINPITARQCRAEGLDVQEGDGPALLSRRPSGSLGAVVALQVVEHWTPEAIFAFLREARRALAPGGLLIAETINTDSLSAWKAFFLDPSHVRPVPSEALQFLAEAAGFVDARVELLSPLPAESRLEESTRNDAKLNRLLFGPQDYALLARAPAAPAGA